MITDPAGENQQFTDDDIQSALDSYRDDIRYEPLQIAPSIVNNANTGNEADTIFADFYSRYGWWESDVTLQAYNDGKAWVVVTPVAVELMVDQAHFQFETDVFASGTAPGQLPPIFATGKVFDRFAAAASLLEMWASSMACAYDITVNGQSLHRSQMSQLKFTLANRYWMQAKPKVVKMNRSDINTLDSVNIRLLG